MLRYYANHHFIIHVRVLYFIISLSMLRYYANHHFIIHVRVLYFIISLSMLRYYANHHFIIHVRVLYFIISLSMLRYYANHHFIIHVRVLYFVISLSMLRYHGEVGIDLPLMLRQSTPAKPLLLLYEKKGDTAERLFTEFAAKKQNKTLSVTLTSNNVSEERQARKLLQKAMAEVSAQGTC